LNRKYVRAFAVVAVIAAAWLPAATTQAAQAAKPSAEFSFLHWRVNQNKPIHISYAVRHIPRGSVLHLQWQAGTDHVWENVKRLSRAATKAIVPGVQIGRYAYRLQVKDGGTVLATSPVRDLFSYGRVSYATICNSSHQENLCGGSGTVQIGSMVFTYTGDEEYPDSYPSYGNYLQWASNTSCRQLTVNFATNDNAPSPTGTAYLQLSQTKSQAQYAQVAANVVGRAVFALDGGPFNLNDSETNGVTIFYNGWANCYTRNGAR
jgi:hypothetical protein